MKARVIKEFIDKHTQQFHAVGEEISLTVERFAEIEKAGPYVVVIEQGEPDEQLDAVPEPHTNDQEQEQPEKVSADVQSEIVEQDEPVEKPKTEKVKKTRRNRK